MSRAFYGADDSRQHGGRPLNYSPPPFSSSPPLNRAHPAAHPDSAYNRLRAQRFSGADYYQDQPDQTYAPPPPAHGHRQHNTGRGLAHTQSTRTTSTVTPGADSMGGAAVGGGIAGVAVGVANSNERESGVEAVRGYQYDTADRLYRGPPERAMYHNPTTDNPYVPSPSTANPTAYRYETQGDYPGNVHGSAMDGHGYTRGHGEPHSGNVHGSAMNGHGYNRGHGEPHYSSAERGMPASYSHPETHRSGPELYDGPYRHRPALGAAAGPEHINPHDIVDDGDDGFIPDPQRRSLLSLGRNSSHNNLPAGAAGAAAAGGASMSDRVLGQTQGSPSGGPSYDAVPPEKSQWLDEENSRKKRLRWIIGIIIVLCIIGGVLGGVLGTILPKGDSDGSDGPGDEILSAEDDLSVNGDLSIDSDEIQALMGNPDLHKVFPGVDYTPWGTQYPLCLTYPPSQNNVTRDMAVLSQMTNAVRLYGTDCNQTQMVLHAIDRLELKDMKLWLGVWIDTNTTTNERQLDQLYDILKSTDDSSVFKGVIVGNEVLFRGHESWETLNSLSKHIKNVKSQLKDMGIDMPVATSDLGDAWTEGLAKVVDVVMANIHPFFGGVPVDEATSWTWNFWAQNNRGLTKGTNKGNIIAEVGWPTGGGSNCSPLEKCPDDKTGAKAGIKQLNQFMADWVCPSLTNGTDYFWFEAFDEPWKRSFNEPGKAWEDKWGLMYPDRTLKPGVKIPDCGGKTAT